MSKNIKTFKTKNLIITIDQGDCISCSTCVSLAPKTFELDNKLKAIVNENTDDNFSFISGVASSCAVDAIKVKKIT